MLRRLRAIVLALLVSIGAAPAGAAHAAFDKPVDLELVLGVDVSRSIDVGEAQLQRQGYIKAFRDPEVVRAITSGMFGRIAVAYFEWAGLIHREIVADWTLIDSKKSAHAFGATLGRELPGSARRTSISGAIDFATVSIGDVADAAGTVLISGAGSALVTRGTDNTVQIGRTAGSPGTLTVVAGDIDESERRRIEEACESRLTSVVEQATSAEVA